MDTQQLLPPHWLECCWDEFPCLLFWPFPALSLPLYASLNLFTPSDLYSVLSRLHFTSWTPCITALSHRGRCLVAAKAYLSEHTVFSQKISRSLKAYFKCSSFSISCSCCLQVSGINASMSRKREQRVLFMVVIMVICYLLCWLPYGIMALLATFGPPGLVTPEASIIPSILAKTSTVINPVIYVFMNKQVSGWEGGREGAPWLRSVPLILCCFKAAGGGHLAEARRLFDIMDYIPVRCYHVAFLTLNNLNYVFVRGWWMRKVFFPHI